MEFPWVAAAIGIPQILQMILGGGGQDDYFTQEQKTDMTTTTEQDYPGWRDPLMGVLSPTVMRALLGNVMRYQGAGMPGGQGLGMGDWFSQLLKMLEAEWPAILEGYKNEEKEEETDRRSNPNRERERVDRWRLENPDRRR